MSYTQVKNLDLSSIIVTEINDNNKKLIFQNPLRLIPVIDEESGQLYVVEYPDIGLHVFSSTREKLINEINEQILMLWNEYAMVDSNILAKDAQKIRVSLLELIQEEPYV